MNGKLDLSEFIPSEIKSGILGNKYPLEIEAKSTEIMLYYFVNVSNQNRANCGKRQFSAVIPRYINRNKKTFEVIGLLQAEMGKTKNETITFANCEPNIIKHVMEWFKEELLIDYKEWKWYIKLNINKPNNEQLKEELEAGLIEFWVMKSQINYDSKYNTAISYIKNTTNQIAANNGTLIIELSSKILTVLVLYLLIKIQSIILTYTKEEIIAYMRGIIAGEACIEMNKKSGRYRVFITAVKPEERIFFQNCLLKSGIESKNYPSIKDLIISRYQNNFKLLELDLMSLNPTKYAKFLEMLSLYGERAKSL